MLCNNCGAENSPGGAVCHECGEKLSVSETTESLPVINDGTDTAQPILADQSAGGATLMVVKGPNIGERYLLSGQTVVVGRDPGSQLFLNDVTVSRVHAKVELSGDRFVLYDSGSLNGTYLNGDRVDQAELRHGDELWIGRFKLIFLMGK